MDIPCDGISTMNMNLLSDFTTGMPKTIRFKFLSEIIIFKSHLSSRL